MSFKQIGIIAAVVLVVLVGVYFLFGLGYILAVVATAAFCWSFPFKTILGWIALGSAKAVAVIDKKPQPQPEPEPEKPA